MIHRHTLGKIPAKPHTTFYENGKLLMEQMITREGSKEPNDWRSRRSRVRTLIQPADTVTWWMIYVVLS